jgi:soluble lytic murein transglycosylase-like protein
MQILRLTATLLLLASTALALEIAELRNGFTIRHSARESREGSVRLFFDNEKTSFIDIPSTEIERYYSEAEALPVPPAALPDALLDVAPPVKSTNQIVGEASRQHGVDQDFIRSVIRQESSGNAHAVSPAGARGLMQLMPGTALHLGVSDSFNSEQNVHGGTLYLRELLERYNGDAIKALAAYNAGPGAVDRYKGVPPYRETRKYVQRVVRDYNKSKRGAEKSAATSAKPAGKPATKAAAAIATPPSSEPVERAAK